MTETVRAEPAAVVAPEDPAIVEIKKRIENAFEIFDHESNKTVDVREVGTIIRSLGCCPSEAELHDMIQEVEEEEPTGFIRWEKFQPMMTRVLLEKRYQPASEEQLVRAFEGDGSLLTYKDSLNLKLSLFRGISVGPNMLAVACSSLLQIDRDALLTQNWNSS
eukprot:Em0014g789a